jgi:hypothetical protein
LEHDGRGGAQGVTGAARAGRAAGLGTGGREHAAVNAINAAVSPVGLSADLQAALDRALKGKADAERALHLAFRAFDRRKKYPPTGREEALYRQFLDGYDRYNRYLYGVAASPALAGKNIYITDDAGYTQVIRPGAELKVLHRNVLENVDVNGVGGNLAKQECFYTGGFFEGGRRYLRGEEYLYAIGAQD